MKIIYLVILIYVCLAIPDTYKRVVHPFRLNKCLVDWPHAADWDAGDPPHEIVYIFQKPFSYLAKGKQSYVFLSADGRYVLKLFRFNQSKIEIGKRISDIIHGLRGRGEREKEKTLLFRIRQTFESASLAYRLAQQQTGVVWAHLNLNANKLNAFIVKDRLGKSHLVDPGRFRFVIQKRANPISKKDGLEISFEQLRMELEALHLRTQDQKIRKNYAMLDGKLILIDIGDLVSIPVPP